VATSATITPSTDRAACAFASETLVKATRMALYVLTIPSRRLDLSSPDSLVRKHPSKALLAVFVEGLLLFLLKILQALSACEQNKSNAMGLTDPIHRQVVADGVLPALSLSAPSLVSVLLEPGVDVLEDHSVSRRIA